LRKYVDAEIERALIDELEALRGLSYDEAYSWRDWVDRRLATLHEPGAARERDELLETVRGGEAVLLKLDEKFMTLEKERDAMQQQIETLRGSAIMPLAHYDELRARAEKAEARVKELETALHGLYAMVNGEAPMLLENDHNAERVVFLLAQKEPKP
jgi:chromosome segregation ATPase